MYACANILQPKAKIWVSFIRQYAGFDEIEMFEFPIKCSVKIINFP